MRGNSKWRPPVISFHPQSPLVLERGLGATRTGLGMPGLDPPVRSLRARRLFWPPRGMLKNSVVFSTACLGLVRGYCFKKAQYVQVGGSRGWVLMPQ